MADRRASCPTCLRSFTTNRANQKWCSPACAPRWRSPKTSKERGLGVRHQKRRAQLLPLAWGTPCPLCGRIMRQGDKLHLDHSLPRSMGGTVGDRIVCAPCNISRGNGTTSSPLLRARRAGATPRTTSRNW